MQSANGKSSGAGGIAAVRSLSTEGYQASLKRYPELRLYAEDPRRVLNMANWLDDMPVVKRRGIQRELALIGAATSREDSSALREWEQNIVKLERVVRPVDLPPGRERWALSGMLTAEEMHVPLGELIDSGRLKSNLLDLLWF